ncbi:Lysophospholipase L1 [Filimonas lacunae]|uniref:Lysophospholipase L1 n=1 Tax=Filimonas lacunae TaxID=477680 RepID=A0A173MD65_9BACT|nr:GDSL-type esterase/lipase family protein [Filimonas lacunae]BAV05457.1 beta-lactamase [Filimonas lacunae]SIT21017.1 Lysophospholipase L1 [Filimonas lacunae]
MKIINSIIILLLAIANGHAQNINWDSTYRPPSYDLRLAQFRMFPNSKNDIIFLGNSITAGVEWQELLGNPNVRNRGISGDITFGVLNRLDEVTEGQPAKVFILIGINDVARGIPDSVTSANHKRMVQYIKAHSPATKIYLQTLLPVNKDFAKHAAHYNKDEKILRINENLRKLAKEEQVELIDLYPKFLNNSDKLVDKYTYDGLHLTAEGYKRWAAVLKEYNAL